MRTPDPRTGLRAIALGGTLLLLAACQTGTEPGDDASPVTTQTTAAETAAPEPTASSEPAPQETTATEPAVNGPNLITAPLDGQTVAGPVVTVTGEGTAFEATLSYAVLVAGTEEVVVQSYTEAGANGEVAPFRFDVELEPGDYTVRVWEADMSDGESTVGPYVNLVEVDVTVS